MYANVVSCVATLDDQLQRNALDAVSAVYTVSLTTTSERWFKIDMLD